MKIAESHSIIHKTLLQTYHEMPSVESESERKKEQKKGQINNENVACNSV